LPANERERIADSDGDRLQLATRQVLDLAALQPALANRDPVRHADQLPVGEHRARPLATVKTSDDLLDALAHMREHGVRLPNGTLTVLQHIILSHHGVPEYGAAKIPATPEAILVSMLDNLDAKTTMSLAAARPDRVASFDAGGNFTEKQWALDTKLFKPDVLKGK
jgi:hypothetical protein